MSGTSKSAPSTIDVDVAYATVLPSLFADSLKDEMDDRFLFNDKKKTQSLSEDILKTLAYIDEHPWRTLFWEWLPFSSKFSPYNQEIFTILRAFILLGLDDIDGEQVDERFDLITELNQYIKTLHNQSHDKIKHKVVCAAFMDKLYEVYDVLVSNGLEDTHPGQAKKIKKLMHHLAEDNHIDNGKRIINLRKMYRRIQKEHALEDKRSLKKRFLDWWHGKKVDPFPHHKYPNIEAKLSGGMYVQTYLVVDHLDNKALTDEEKQAILEEQRRHPTQPNNKTLNRRKWKNYIFGIALFCSIVIGIGEGIAAAFTFTPVMLTFLAIAISGFFLNYFIFQQAFQETLKKLFLMKLFQDKNGDDITLLKKIAITASSLVALSGAISIGFFSYSTASTALIAFGASPIMVICLAGLIASVTTLALACAFFVCLSDLIANERYKSIWQYCKDVFLLPGYQTASLSQWAGHIVKIMVNLAVLAAMGFIFTLACIASAGIYHQKALSFLHNTVKVNAWLGSIGNTFSQIFTAIFVDGIAVGINFNFFNIINLSKFALTLRETLLSILFTIPKIVTGVFHFIRHPIEASSDFKQSFLATYHHTQRKFNRPLSLVDGISLSFQRISLLVSAFTNSIGQAIGFNTGFQTAQPIESVTKSHYITSALSLTTAAGVNSAAAGVRAIFEEYTSGERVTQANHTASTRQTAIDRLQKGAVKTEAGDTIPYTYNAIHSYQQQLAFERAAARRNGLHKAFPIHKDASLNVWTMFSNTPPHTNEQKLSDEYQTTPVV